MLFDHCVVEDSPRPGPMPTEMPLKKRHRLEQFSFGPLCTAVTKAVADTMVEVEDEFMAARCIYYVAMHGVERTLQESRWAGPSRLWS